MKVETCQRLSTAGAPLFVAIQAWDSADRSVTTNEDVPHSLRKY